MDKARLAAFTTFTRDDLQAAAQDPQAFISSRNDHAHKLVQDIKEVSLLISGTHRLQARFEEDGPKLLTWMPSTIRHLLHVRIVGSLDPLDTPDSNTQQDAVLRALVLLELSSRVSDVLSDPKVKRELGRGFSTSPGHRSPSPSLSDPSGIINKSTTERNKRSLIRGELTRIRVSAEDTKELLEEELEQIRSSPLSSAVLSPLLPGPRSPFELVRSETRRAQSSDMVEDFRYSKSTAFDEDDDGARSVTSFTSTSSYAHPILDKSLPASSSRHAPRPDLVYEHQTLISALRVRAHSRTSTFPLALGLLAQCIVRGTLPVRPGKEKGLERKRTSSVGHDVQL